MITADAQQLEPGGRITLFELDASSFGADQLFFHAHLQSGVIWWQGQEYGPWPIEATGFSRTSDQPPNPRLKVSNIDGRITALCLMFDDLVGARVIRRQTLVKYLDGANFPPLRNLLVNSGFEFSNSGAALPTRYVSSSSRTFSVSYVPASDGRALRMLVANADGGAYIGTEPEVASRPEVTAGQTYTNSVYAYGRMGQRMDLYIQFLGASGAVIGSTRQQSFFLNGTRQRYSVSALCPAGGVRARAIWRGHNSGTAGDIDLTIDNAQFEQGSVATEYQFTNLDLTSSRNPTADPNEHFLDEIWFIERKVSETKEVVEFELTTAIDLNGEQLPGRQVIAGVCGWLIRGGYRGPYCGYNGPAVADANDVPTTDPARDQCGGRVNSCKLRFGADKPLPYGGFPAAGLLRT